MHFFPTKTENSPQSVLFAWLAHLFTATGVIWGFFSILAIFDGRWVDAFMWMGVAIFVDSFDGLIARRARVKEVAPGIDGALLDNILDYLNYVVVPALFIFQYSQTNGLLPANLSMMAASLIMLSSAFQFTQNDAKTEDHYFKGFPSYWNAVAFYLFILNLAPSLNFTIIIALVILVFVPIKYVYPSRTVRFQRVTMTLSMLWGILYAAILLRYPVHESWLVGLSLLFVVYYLGISLYSMVSNR